MNITISKNSCVPQFVFLFFLALFFTDPDLGSLVCRRWFAVCVLESLASCQQLLRFSQTKENPVPLQSSPMT